MVLLPDIRSEKRMQFISDDLRSEGESSKPPFALNISKSSYVFVSSFKQMTWMRMRRKSTPTLSKSSTVNAILRHSGSFKTKQTWLVWIASSYVSISCKLFPAARAPSTSALNSAKHYLNLCTCVEPIKEICSRSETTKFFTNYTS
jgi:hypothetical protein